MCFEFEWLYWAQMAQEEEQRRKDAANRVDAQSDLQSSPLHDDSMASLSKPMVKPTVNPTVKPMADSQRLEQRKPLHA